MDRPAYLKVYLSDCYNLGVLGGVSVSEQVLWLGWSVAVRAPAKATVDCVAAWATDFRRDLPTIDVPVLVLQGNQDRVFPIQATGQRLPALIKDAQLMVIEGGHTPSTGRTLKS
jgi:non-heme chloroperoxidase